MGPLCALINKQWKIHTYTQENTWRTPTLKVQRHMHECHFCPHHTNTCSKFKNDLWLLPPVNSLCAVGWSLISKSWQTHLKQQHSQSCVSFFIAAPYEDPAAPFIWPENVFTRSPNKSELQFKLLWVYNQHTPCRATEVRSERTHVISTRLFSLIFYSLLTSLIIYSCINQQSRFHLCHNINENAKLINVGHSNNWIQSKSKNVLLPDFDNHPPMMLWKGEQFPSGTDAVVIAGRMHTEAIRAWECLLREDNFTSPSFKQQRHFWVSHWRVVRLWVIIQDVFTLLVHSDGGSWVKMTCLD